MALKLYGYWRSSATYRVRIALNLKQLDYDYIPVHLVKEGGEQHSESYRHLNPAQLVPTLVDDDEDIILNQSMSIVEYLDEKYPQPHQLLPVHPVKRARVRALAQDLACDIQPLNNLRVLQTLTHRFGADENEQAQWVRDWSQRGFTAIEQRLHTQAGQFCFNFEVSLADICLVPQVYNARRFGLDIDSFPLISKIYSNCNALETFANAKPENQPDAVQ